METPFSPAAPSGSERTAYVTHHDCSRHDTGWGHLEHQGRLPAVARAVHRDMLTLFDRLLEVEGVPAQRADLEIAHAPSYVARVQERCREAASADTVLELEGETRVSGASWDALLAGVGCVMTAVQQVQAGEARNAFCAVRPPGHGASAAAPGGFSIFNGVAIAALHALRRPPESPLWVIDLGARPGDGTAALLAANPAVCLVDVSGASAGEVADRRRDIISRSLAPGSGVGEALAALRDALDAAEARFTPGLIFLSLGFDFLSADPQGELALEPRDYYDLTLEVRRRAERLCDGRLVSVLEEGYAAPEMGKGVVQHLRALTGLPPEETG